MPAAPLYPAALVLSVRIQDCRTVLSGGNTQSYSSPAIPGEGSAPPLPLGTPTPPPRADATKREHGSETFEEKRSSTLENECGTHEESLLDKEAV